MKIDSHHHFWKYSPESYGWISDRMEILKRDFLPPDLKRELQAAGIDAAISVQASQTLDETRRLIEIADTNAFIAGVVGWVPLASDTLTQELSRLTEHSILKGVRHVVHDEPDDRFILGDAFNRGIAVLKEFGLVYDILIFAKHLKSTLQFVDRHPEQVFVLDHIAKPTIAAGRFDQEWAADFRELARRDHVFCKFSGVVTEVRDAQWQPSLLKPYWDVALNAFGTNRLMFGSDWPVCLLKSSYLQWVQTVTEFTAPLAADERTAFWGANAAKVYGLNLPR